MPIKFRPISSEDFTYTDAFELASIYAVAFRDDSGMLFGRPPAFRFNGDILSSILSIRNPIDRLNVIVKRAECFRDHVAAAAWRFYGAVKLGDGRPFIAYDSSDGVPVAMALWTVPKPLRRKLSLLEWIGRQFLKCRVALNLMWYKYIRGADPTGGSRAHVLFEHIIKDVFDLKNSKEKEKKLESSSPSDLTRLKRFPTELTYTLELFGCSRQGRGLGTEFFEQTLKSIEAEMTPIPLGDTLIPPRAQIIASGPGTRLYSKFGFDSIQVHDADIEPGLPCYLNLMYRDYSSKMPKNST